MKSSRVAALLLALCTACSRGPEQTVTSTPSQAAISPSATIPAVSPHPPFDLRHERPPLDGPAAELLPFAGEPPVWPLSEAKTNAIARGLYQLLEGSWQPYAPVRERCEGIPRERPPLYGEGRIGGSAPIEGCLRPYLEELGVQDRALDLFFDTGIVIWESIPIGPFWIGRGYDYDMFGSNGFPPDYLFTPTGVLDLAVQLTSSVGWTPLERAYRDATHEPEVVRVRQAYAEAFDEPLRYVGFFSYGETIALIPSAREYASGWAVPFTWEMRGCHACGIPIRGVFLLGVSDGGVPVGVRYLGLCFDPSDRAYDRVDVAVDELFGLADCASVEKVRA